jgi:hypothetical protein
LYGPDAASRRWDDEDDGGRWARRLLARRIWGRNLHWPVPPEEGQVFLEDPDRGAAMTATLVWKWKGHA